MDLFSGVGIQEILMVLLVVMLVVGPNKIVEFGKTMGNVSRNLKQKTRDFTSGLNAEIEEEMKTKQAKTTPDTPVKT